MLSADGIAVFGGGFLACSQNSTIIVSAFAVCMVLGSSPAQLVSSLFVYIWTCFITGIQSKLALSGAVREFVFIMRLTI